MGTTAKLMAGVAATAIVMMAGCQSSRQHSASSMNKDGATSVPVSSTTPDNADTMAAQAPVRPKSETGWPSESSDRPAKRVAQTTTGYAPTPISPAAPDNVTRSEIRERAIQVLEEAAFSDTPLLRANAMEGLHAAPTRAESVARAGLVDENIGVRFTAAMTVGKLKLSSAASSVRPLVEDASPMVRASAIYALTRNNQKVDQSPLGMMLKDPDPRVRSQAAFVLGEIGNPSAIPMLKESARAEGMSDSSGVRLFRLQVAEALVKLGDSTAATSLDAALYPKLPEEFEAAVLAAQIMGEVKSERAIWQLVTIVESKAPRGSADGGSSPGDQYLYPKELRLAAATALAKMGQPDGVFVADELRADPNPAIRSQTAFLYSATGKRGYLSTLRGLLDDSSPIVRVAAAAAVLRLTDGSK